MAEQQWWCARLNVKEDEDEEEVTISIVFDVGEKGLLFSPSLSNYDENVDDDDGDGSDIPFTLDDRKKREKSFFHH